MAGERGMGEGGVPSQIVRGDIAHGRQARGMAPALLSATHRYTRASTASGSRLGAHHGNQGSHA